MNVVAIIPVKPLCRAKSRLAPFLEPPERERLAVNMLRRVIRAAREGVDEVWVLGTDAVEAASSEGAGFRRETGANVNESLDAVFREAWTAGKSPLFLPGDLPFIQPSDLRGLTAKAGDGRPAVLAPARRGGGTNAILIPQPSDFRLSLGPDSFQRHLAQAKALGLDPVVRSSPGLANDLDTWEDVQEYEGMEPGLLERLTRE